MSVALITGGLRGVGHSLTTHFLDNGWSVLSLSRKDYPDARAALASHAAKGSWLKHEAVDLEAVEALPARIEKLLSAPDIAAAGGLKAVINNAATQGPVGTIGEIALEDWIACQKINLHAPVAICKAALPFMRAGGTIINFTGGGGAKAQHFFSAYSTSKAAIVRFTECLSRELQEQAPNVGCFVVTPGFVKTEIHNVTLEAGAAKAREFHAFVEKNLAKGGNDPMKVAQFCLKLTDPAYIPLSGRFFSGVFDDLGDEKLVAALKADEDLFTLRRIDNFAFKRA